MLNRNNNTTKRPTGALPSSTPDIGRAYPVTWAAGVLMEVSPSWATTSLLLVENQQQRNHRWVIIVDTHDLKAKNFPQVTDERTQE